MSIFTGLFGRIAGSAFGSWFSGNLFLIIGIAFLSLATLTGYYKYTSVRNAGRADLAEEQYKNLKKDYEAVLISIDINKLALQHCRVLNTANNKALEQQKQATQNALLQVKLVQAKYPDTIKTIHSDGEKLHGQDTECRSVDAPLPDWFIVGLYE